MALLVSDILLRVRDQHALFSRQRVTDAVLLRSLSTYQSTLLAKALLRDRSYLAQQASIAFAAQAASGAGVGGFPASVANDGTVSRSRQPTGYLKDLDVSTGVVLVGEFVPTSSTATSVTLVSATWTTSQFVNSYLVVTAGTGIDQVQVITANTATTVSWATPLTTLLDGTSVVQIVSVASSVDEDLSVVTAMPPRDTHDGYLIKLDANGVAYIDTTTPLVATFDRGVPLPKYKTILGGTVRFTQPTSVIHDVCEFVMVDYASRNDALGSYSGYIQNRQLFLNGDQFDWTDVESIDLRYVPEPPRLSALTDYFLLPDHAEAVLVAHGAFIAGQRVQGLEGMSPPDMGILTTERATAETAFLTTVGAQTRATQQRMRSVW